MDQCTLPGALPAGREVLAELLSLYFQAWRTRSVDLLERVFAPDADYYEKPYQPPLHGLDEIRAYWRDEVLPQQDIHIEVSRVGYGDADVFAEWETCFRRGGLRVQVNGMLVLIVDLQKRRVVALREYFRSRELQE